MIGLPWSQHVAFLSDRDLARRIRRETVEHVRTLGAHPAALLFAVGNEIPPSVVRWHGASRVEEFLQAIYQDAKAASPDSLLTYVSGLGGYTDAWQHAVGGVAHDADEHASRCLRPH